MRPACYYYVSFELEMGVFSNLQDISGIKILTHDPQSVNCCFVLAAAGWNWCGWSFSSYCPIKVYFCLSDVYFCSDSCFLFFKMGNKTFFPCIWVKWNVKIRMYFRFYKYRTSRKLFIHCISCCRQNCITILSNIKISRLEIKTMPILFCTIDPRCT